MADPKRGPDLSGGADQRQKRHQSNLIGTAARVEASPAGSKPQRAGQVCNLASHGGRPLCPQSGGPHSTRYKVRSLLYRFEFPERPGALMALRQRLHPNWTISISITETQGAGRRPDRGGRSGGRWRTRRLAGVPLMDWATPLGGNRQSPPNACFSGPPPPDSPWWPEPEQPAVRCPAKELWRVKAGCERARPRAIKPRPKQPLACHKGLGRPIKAGSAAESISWPPGWRRSPLTSKAGRWPSASLAEIASPPTARRGDQARGELALNHP